MEAKWIGNRQLVGRRRLRCLVGWKCDASGEALRYVSTPRASCCGAAQWGRESVAEHKRGMNCGGDATFLYSCILASALALFLNGRRVQNCNDNGCVAVEESDHESPIHSPTSCDKLALESSPANLQTCQKQPRELATQQAENSSNHGRIDYGPSASRLPSSSPCNSPSDSS